MNKTDDVLIIAPAYFSETHDGTSMDVGDIVDTAWDALGSSGAFDAIGKGLHVVFAVTRADSLRLAHDRAGEDSDESKMSVLRRALGSTGVTVAVSKTTKPEVAGRVTLDVTLAPGEVLVLERIESGRMTVGAHVPNVVDAPDVFAAINAAELAGVITATEALRKRAKVNTVGYLYASRSSPDADLTRTAEAVINDVRKQLAK